MEPGSDSASGFAKLDSYLGFARETAAWLGRRADRFHWFYNFEKVAIALLGLSLPLLSQGLLGPCGEAAVPWVGVTIAAMAALDAFYKPGETWRHFRSYQLSLLRSLRELEPVLAQVHLESDPGVRAQRLLTLYEQFVRRVEDLLEQEAGKFFERVKPPDQTVGGKPDDRVA